MSPFSDRYKSGIKKYIPQLHYHWLSALARVLCPEVEAALELPQGLIDGVLSRCVQPGIEPQRCPRAASASTTCLACHALPRCQRSTDLRYLLKSLMRHGGRENLHMGPIVGQQRFINEAHQEPQSQVQMSLDGCHWLLHTPMPSGPLVGLSKSAHKQ